MLKPLRAKRPFWNAMCPPSASGFVASRSAASRRARLTTKGTRCFLLGSLGKRRTRRIFASPAFCGICRTKSGPFCTQFATCPRASVRPVLHRVKMRTTGCTGDRSSSSKYVSWSQTAFVGPKVM